MRYCHQCNRITAGEPLFCNFCGRSYDLKLCPHRHPNPRTAEVCSQCGSRDFSTPQPRVSLLAKVMLKSLSGLMLVLPGLALLLVALLLLVGFVEALATSTQFQSQFLAGMILIAIGWWMYLQLPGFLRKGLMRLFSKGKRKDSNEH